MSRLLSLGRGPQRDDTPIITVGDLREGFGRFRADWGGKPANGRETPNLPCPLTDFAGCSAVEVH